MTRDQLDQLDKITTSFTDNIDKLVSLLKTEGRLSNTQKKIEEHEEYYFHKVQQSTARKLHP